MGVTPAGMSSQALEIVANDKIVAAIAAGEFANLPGLGKPHPIFDEEYDPHWWIRRKLAREGLRGDLLTAGRNL